MLIRVEAGKTVTDPFTYDVRGDFDPEAIRDFNRRGGVQLTVCDEVTTNDVYELNREDFQDLLDGLWHPSTG